MGERGWHNSLAPGFRFSDRFQIVILEIVIVAGTERAQYLREVWHPLAKAAEDSWQPVGYSGCAIAIFAIR